VLWLQQRYDRQRLSSTAGRIALLAVAGAVGLGTLVLDTHRLSDVLAGWAISALLLLAPPLTDRINAHNEVRRKHPACPVSDPLRQEDVTLVSMRAVFTQTPHQPANVVRHP
jgi:membrane-associated phospholipid phosphatase